MMTAADGWVTGGRVELALRKTLLLQVVQPVSTPVPSFCHHSCHHFCHHFCHHSCHCQHRFPFVLTFVIIIAILPLSSCQRLFGAINFKNICIRKWKEVRISGHSRRWHDLMLVKSVQLGTIRTKPVPAFVLFCRDGPTLCSVLLSSRQPGRPPARICC